MTHELKCWPFFFDALRSGAKRFEVRKNDRSFRVGDHLYLREYQPGGLDRPARYTGRSLRVTVDYLMMSTALPGGLLGADTVVMGLGIPYDHRTDDRPTPPANASLTEVCQRQVGYDGRLAELENTVIRLAAEIRQLKEGRHGA